MGLMKRSGIKKVVQFPEMETGEARENNGLGLMVAGSQNV